MENNEYRVNSRYRFSSRLKGEVELTLFNDHYLHVSEKQMKRSSNFKLEVATLDPAAEPVEEQPYHWLAAAVLCVLASVAILYLLFTSPELSGIMMPLAGMLITLVLAGAFTTLFFYSSERKWVIKTRAASYPLITIPFTKGRREEATAFLTQLQQAIENNVTKRGYSSDDLFAGEMRMLRRLAKHNVLSPTVYDRAKAHMLKSHQHVTA